MIERVDPVYGYLVLEEVSRGWLREVPFLRQEHQRLEEMTQLGLLKLLHPLTRHTRREHHEGLCFLTEKAVKNLSGAAFKTNTKNMVFASLVHGLGHLAMGSDAEMIIPALLYKHPELGKDLVDELNEVRRRVRLAGGTKVPKPLRDSPWRLYRWLSAVKLLRNEKGIQQNVSGVEINVVARLLLDRGWKEASFLDSLDRYDYVLRDSFYAGRVSLGINFPAFFHEMSRSSNVLKLPYSEAIAGIEKVLRKRVYETNESIALRAVFRCHLMGAMVNEEVEIDDLLTWTDNDLNTILRGKTGWNPELRVREIHDGRARELYRGTGDATDRKSWRKRAWSIYTAARFKQKPFQNQIQANVFPVICLPRDAQEKPSPGVRVSVFSFENANLQRALIAVSESEREIQFKASYQPLCLLFDSVDVDYVKYSSAYGKSVKITLGEKSLEETYRSLGVENLQPPDIWPFFDFLKSWVPEAASKIMDKDMCDEAIDYSLTHFQQVPEDYRAKILGGLAKPRGKEKGLVNELITWLKRQVELAPGIASEPRAKWVFPEVSLTAGEKDYSIDLIALYLFRSRKPVVDLIECSVNLGTSKRLSDQEKLERLRHWITTESPLAGQVRIRCFFNDEILD